MAARLGKSLQGAIGFALIALGLEVFRVRVGGKCFEDNNFMVLDRSW